MTSIESGDHQDKLIKYSENELGPSSSFEIQPNIIPSTENLKTIKNTIQLFVSNLSYQTNEKKLKQHFGKAGKVLMLFIPKNEYEIYAFVLMKNGAAAEKAIKLLNNQIIDDNEIQIEISNFQPLPQLIALGNLTIFPDEQINILLNSNSINNTIKEELLNQIQQQFQHSNREEKKVAQAKNEMNNLNYIKLENCSTVSLRILIRILELLFKSGCLNGCNYEDKKKSSIISKIENLFVQQVQQEENIEDHNFSDLIQQLAAFLYLVLEFVYNEENIIEHIKITINKNINNLINIMQRKNDDLEFNMNNIMKDEEIEEQMKFINKILKIQDNNEKCYDSENHFQSIIIHDCLIQLIHINCSISLQCTKRINLKSTLSVLNLQSSALNLFENLPNQYYNESYPKDKFILFNHLVHFDIEIVNNELFHKLQIEDQYSQSIIINFQNIIYSSLILLHRFMFNKENVSIVTAFPFIIPPLIKLMNYHLLDRQNENNDIIIYIGNDDDNEIEEQVCKAVLIRRQSCECLDRIIEFGDNDDVEIFITNNYISSLISLIGTCGGSESERNVEIDSAVKNIFEFFTLINNKMKSSNKYEYFKSETIKTNEEFVEEQNGQEEIDGLMFNQDKKIIIHASNAKNQIINKFNMQGNNNNKLQRNDEDDSEDIIEDEQREDDESNDEY